MSTRSDIIRQNLDGSFDAIYCHWDGYPSHNGRILLEHYTNAQKVGALIALGSLSVLGEDIGEKHNFNAQIDGVCTAYGRDRGEPGVETKHFKSKAALAKYLKKSWTEWCYVYRVADGKWYFTNNPSPTWFKCCGTEQRGMDELTLEAIEVAA